MEKCDTERRLESMHLLVTAGGLLLLVVLVLLVAGRAGQGLLEDLQDLLILDLLVGLEPGKVGSVGCGKLGDAVLRDGCARQRLAMLFSPCLSAFYGKHGLHTESGQQTRNGEVIRTTGRLVLTDNTGTDALDNANLGSLLIIELAQTEGESTELLDDFRQRLTRAGTLQTVGGGGTAVQGSTVVEVLDLATAHAEADLNTPNLTNLGNTITTDTIAGRQDDLLGAFDLVAVKQPASGVLDHVAVVGLGNLLQEGGDLSLGRGLLGGGLLLLLLSSLGQQTGRDHETQQKLVGVVGCDNQISLTASDNILGGVLRGNDNHVTDNGSEAIDLSTQLDLDDLTGLQGSLGLGGVGHKGGVGCHIGARRDGSRVRDTWDHRCVSIPVAEWHSCRNQPTFGDLLALVDLGNFLIEELVTLLADLDDLLALEAHSCTERN